jgi:hypothetical protein
MCWTMYHRICSFYNITLALDPINWGGPNQVDTQVPRFLRIPQDHNGVQVAVPPEQFVHQANDAPIVAAPQWVIGGEDELEDDVEQLQGRVNEDDDEAPIPAPQVNMNVSGRPVHANHGIIDCLIPNQPRKHRWELPLAHRPINRRLEQNESNDSDFHPDDISESSLN